MEMLKTVLILYFLPRCISVCVPSITTISGRTTCQDDLIFEDNFDLLDNNKWQHVFQIASDKKDADFVYYQNSPGCAYVYDGVFHIQPRLLEEIPGFSESIVRGGELEVGNWLGDTDRRFFGCTGIDDVQRECYRKAGGFRILPPVASAKIRTRHTFNFRYGTVQVRAKLPKGDWLFPLITLEPTINYYGQSGYASGQIRIAFIHGNEQLETKSGDKIDGSVLSAGVVLNSGEEHRTIWMKRVSDEHINRHMGEDFHTYAVSWSNESLRFSVDGVSFAKINRHFFSSAYFTQGIEQAHSLYFGSRLAPFDKEFHLSIGVSAGGIADFPDGCLNGPNRSKKPWENSSPKGELQFWKDRKNWRSTWKGEDAALKVDYVRVYALDDLY